MLKACSIFFVRVRICLMYSLIPYYQRQDHKNIPRLTEFIPGKCFSFFGGMEWLTGRWSQTFPFTVLFIEGKTINKHKEDQMQNHSKSQMCIVFGKLDFLPSCIAFLAAPFFVLVKLQRYVLVWDWFNFLIFYGLLWLRFSCLNILNFIDWMQMDSYTPWPLIWNHRQIQFFVF